MKTHSSTKILQFPRKGVSQARESAELHSDGQVLPLYKAGGDMLGIGVAAADFGYNLRDRSWGVALISMLAIISVELRKLREVRISRERFFDGLAVEDVSISGQLDAMVSDAIPEVTHESLSVSAGSFPYQECRNEFGVRVQRDENPLISEVAGSSLRTCRAFFIKKVQISSHWIRRQGNWRILRFINLSERSPASTSSRMMVFRLSPVSRSVVRIEQPSSRHFSACAAASGLVRMVPRGDWD